MKHKIGDRPDDGAWIHSELDDFGLTTPEFRVYCHILRRAGTGGNYWEGAKKAASICRINRDTYDKAIEARIRTARRAETLELLRGAL